MQILVKDNFVQSELGMRAGFCRRSCRLTHTMKMGIKDKLIVSNAMMSAC